MKVDLVVKNAKLVSPRNITEAGVAIKDGVIVSVARDIHLPEADHVIDARGNYILPGLLDGHAHTYLPPETGMKAAAKGGLTTMLEMPGTQMGCFNLEQYKEKRATMKKVAYVDFCVHAGCASGYPEGTLTEMWKERSHRRQVLHQQCRTQMAPNLRRRGNSTFQRTSTI